LVFVLSRSFIGQWCHHWVWNPGLVRNPTSASICQI